jgi:RNA polymerase sigma-70 factor (ECF subfamily)
LEADRQTLSNATLLAKLQAGDDASFEALFLRHYARIYGLILRLLDSEEDAEDVTQQVFLKLYHAPERVQIQNDEVNLVGWLYRTAVNQGYNLLRNQKRRSTRQERFARLWPLSNPFPDPAHLAESQDTQTRVRQILVEMQPREAKLLLLRHAGLSYKELAIALDVAPGSVGSLLTQAKRAFGQKYRRTFPEKE